MSRMKASERKSLQYDPTRRQVNSLQVATASWNWLGPSGIVADIIQAIRQKASEREAYFVPGTVLVRVERPQPVQTVTDETILAIQGSPTFWWEGGT